MVPGSAHALAEIVSRSGLPAGVFNLVMGRGSQIGDTLLKHPDIAAVSFTGSVATGLEYAVADAALARMAAALGQTDDQRELERRAGFYRNYFDPLTGFDCAARS